MQNRYTTAVFNIVLNYIYYFSSSSLSSSRKCSYAHTKTRRTQQQKNPNPQSLATSIGMSEDVKYLITFSWRTKGRYNHSNLRRY